VFSILLGVDEKIMLTPTDIQILVGLLTLVTNPDDIEIMLGDYVYDAKAEKRRDVDVTITCKDTNGILSAFKGIEVKKHKNPLDVICVEQLCAKFNDMHAISHKAIVSASGYTKPARKKAEAHGVILYSLIPWSDRLESFEHAQLPPNFFIQQQVPTVVDGKVIYKEYNLLPEYKMLVKDGESKPDVGFAIVEMAGGNLGGITVSQVDRNINWISIPVSDRNKKKIQKLRLK
jgi:hypothetical protein